MNKVKVGVGSFFSSIKQRASKTYSDLNSSDAKAVATPETSNNAGTLDDFNVVNEGQVEAP